MPSPTASLASARGKLLARLAVKTERDDALGCLLWTGSVSPQGYSTIYVRGVASQLVHRSVYDAFVARVSGTLVVDHICGIKNCVEPHHLRCTTQADNTRYRVSARKGSASGLPGVRRRRKRWQGSFNLDGKFHDAGVFDTPEEAKIAVDALRAKVTGRSGYAEEIAALSAMWRQIKANPSISYIPLDPTTYLPVPA